MKAIITTVGIITSIIAVPLTAAMTASDGCAGSFPCARALEKYMADPSSPVIRVPRFAHALALWVGAASHLIALTRARATACRFSPEVSFANFRWKPESAGDLLDCSGPCNCRPDVHLGEAGMRATHCVCTCRPAQRESARKAGRHMLAEQTHGEAKSLAGKGYRTVGRPRVIAMSAAAPENRLPRRTIPGLSRRCAP